MRATLLLLLLLAPSLAGCAEEAPEPRRAQPTDEPIVMPGDEPVRPTGAQYDQRDPGYVVTAAWAVGDGWDYESNRSAFRRVRVVEERVVGSVSMLRVEERTGRIDGPVTATRSWWVDPRTWSLVNATNVTSGAKDTYQPGAPLRQWRNTTTTYNHTYVDRLGRASNESLQLTSRLLPQHQTLLFPWGYVEAKRVEQRTIARVGGNVTGQSIMVRWVHRDYLNDVQYAVDDHELFKLTAAQVGSLRRGTLVG